MRDGSPPKLQGHDTVQLQLSATVAVSFQAGCRAPDGTSSNSTARVTSARVVRIERAYTKIPEAMYLPRHAWPALLIGAAAVWIYFFRLGSAPMMIGGDEAYFASHAHAIATTGRDLDGRFLPLFFRIDIHTWYQPLLVYLMAAVFSIVQVSEAALRTPTALIGVIDVLLVYAVAQRLLGRRRDAVVAAVVMALTPAHFILARQGLDYIAPLPFVLGWLWCLLVALDTGRARFAAAAGLLLGIGFYSYIAAWVVMPVCLVITLVAVISNKRPARLAAAAVVGFALPLMLLVVWLRLQPDTLTAIAARYGFDDANSPRTAFRYLVIQRRLSLYWSYFDPVYLFLAGSPNVTMSTSKAGVFLVSCAVFLPVGIYETLRRMGGRLIVLAGFVLAPLAPVLIDTGNAIQRSLVIVGFGAILSAIGASVMLDRRRRLTQALAMLLLLAMPLQWAYFSRDYFTDYRSRSAGWIDPLNFDAVMRAILAGETTAPVPRVYLSESLDDGEARWRFYLAKYGRDELWERTWIIEPSGRNAWSVGARLDPVLLDTNAPPVGSVFVLGAASPAVERLTVSAGCCSATQVIAGATADPVVVIVQPRVPLY